MKIGVERQEGTLIAKAEGRIDGYNASEFEQSVREAMEDGDRAVVMDLASLTYISSAGLRAILVIAKSLSQRDIKLGLCSLTAPIREVFEISGFDKVVALYDSRPDALAAVG